MPGLVLRKLFLYLAHLKESKRKYRGGLRQLAEHMHHVTHTMEVSQEAGTAAASKSSTARSRLGNNAVGVEVSTDFGAAAAWAKPGSVASSSSSPYAAGEQMPPNGMRHGTLPPLVRTAETSFFSKSDVVASKPATPGGIQKSYNEKEDQAASIATCLKARRMSRMQNFLDLQD